MFNTVIQPTGVYGSFPQMLNGGAGSAPISAQTNVQSVLEQPSADVAPTAKKPKKKLRLLPKLALALAVAVGIVWGLPALRKTAFNGDSKKVPVDKLFIGSDGKEIDTMFKPFKRGFAKIADAIDEKLRTPAKNFLQENVFKFKNKIKQENNYLNIG